MRRALVLRDERARHPFLASLPPHVRAGAAPQPAAREWGISAQDLRDAAATWCAGFVAVSLYFA